MCIRDRSQPASGPGQRGRGAGQPGGTNGRSVSIRRVSTGTMPGSVVDRARHVHPRPGLVVLVDGLPRLHSASVGTGRRTTDTEFVGLDWSGLSGHGETTSRKESIILNEDLAE